jgi:DNA-binding SARP family transcriptional activator
VIELRLLGPLEVLADGRPVPIPRGLERALLALLALNAGRPVAVDRLVEELWEGGPPENAAKSVQIYVSRLRKSLGNDRIETTTSGYVLRLDPQALDIARFESLHTDGRNALERENFSEARRTLSEALGLWRGDALGDFRFATFAQDEIRRLDELRRRTPSTRSSRWAMQTARFLDCAPSSTRSRSGNDRAHNSCWRSTGWAGRQRRSSSTE